MIQLDWLARKPHELPGFCLPSARHSDVHHDGLISYFFQLKTQMQDLMLPQQALYQLSQLLSTSQQHSEQIWNESNCVTLAVGSVGREISSTTQSTEWWLMALHQHSEFVSRRQRIRCSHSHTGGQRPGSNLTIS